MDGAGGSGSTPGTRTASPRHGTTKRPGVQAAYRLLQIRGLGSAEAANLTAWLTGIPVREHHWDIRQVQKLLFLRRLNEMGRFGKADGAQR